MSVIHHKQNLVHILFSFCHNQFIVFLCLFLSVVVLYGIETLAEVVV